MHVDAALRPDEESRLTEDLQEGETKLCSRASICAGAQRRSPLLLPRSSEQGWSQLLALVSPGQLSPALRWHCPRLWRFLLQEEAGTLRWQQKNLDQRLLSGLFKAQGENKQEGCVTMVTAVRRLKAKTKYNPDLLSEPLTWTQVSSPGLRCPHLDTGLLLRTSLAAAGGPVRPWISISSEVSRTSRHVSIHSS